MQRAPPRRVAQTAGAYAVLRIGEASSQASSGALAGGDGTLHGGGGDLGQQGLLLPQRIDGALTTLASVGQATAQPIFINITDQVGLTFGGRSARTIDFVDYNNDGFQDVFVSEDIIRVDFADGRISTDHLDIGLFYNTGDGRLVDVASALPRLPSTSESLSLLGEDYPLDFVGDPGVVALGGAIFADYDNDGDEDCYLPVIPYNVLLRNDRGRFTNVPFEADPTALVVDQAIWLDYDRDGHLDLYAANWSGTGNRLFRNTCTGPFADGTAAAGLDSLVSPPIWVQFGGSLGGLSGGDFNNDSWPDLYMGVFLGPNRLFLNDGRGGFLDATTGRDRRPRSGVWDGNRGHR
jgi:hypothetical protein